MSSLDSVCYLLYDLGKAFQIEITFFIFQQGKRSKAEEYVHGIK